jgi:hypothetical protein
MKRSELEHVIRASADIANDDEIIIVGSQAILGQFPDAPTDLLVSVEADVYPKNHPERAELIDGSIGELSPFHDTFGYYAQGVGPETAMLPVGWESRLVRICNANTRGATGLCLEVHDLVLAKYVANRDKDRRFIAGAIRHGLVREQELLARVPTLPVDVAVRDRVAAQISLDFPVGHARRSDPRA